MTAADLMAELLAEIRRRFFPSETLRRWMQEQTLIKQAICFPAQYLNERGAKLPGARYREILRAILADIERHMRAKGEIRRMAAYILHAVQAHMKHQGDRYVQEGKRIKTAGPVASREVSRLKPADPDLVVKSLAETHAVLASRQQRRCKPAAETQQDLFSTPAKRKP